ncbi:MAG: hypothetical protein LBQ06_04625 [Frankiaceae bacterium]|nr:hypothetical protein [Frankiaceae bacterium]
MPTSCARPSRRTFLIASATALAAGAGGGVAVGFTWHRPAAPKPPEPDPVLVSVLRAAVAGELARAAAAQSIPGTLGQLVAANHAEHERVLRSLLPASALADVVPAAVDSSSLAAVRAAESAASTAAAQDAARLDGAAAVLLAAISACEAAHAELLS